MRSFAEYRKQRLFETINEVTLQEGLEKRLEVLRLDLLEAVKLPPMPQSNILAEVQYHRK